MAERVLVVCDVCGATPAETVGIRVKGRNVQKDLCASHLAELLKGARAPRRGRPRRAASGAATSAPAAAAAPKRRGRPRKTASGA